MKRVFSEEHIRHLRESHRGYRMPESQKKKISAALAGKKKGVEHRLNMSMARKGVPLSSIHVEKIRAIKRAWGSRADVKRACSRRAKESWKSPVYREKYQQTIKAKWDARGPITKYNGYLLVKKPEHPKANSQGYVLLHRLVMERALGRFLNLKEIVHHVDGNIKNNDLSNLMLLRGNAEHQRVHAERRAANRSVSQPVAGTGGTP